MADNTLDEYKPVKFYTENTTPKKAGFSKFKHGDSYYFCRYLDNKIVLLSQAYTGQPGRDNGIESVKKNEKLAKRYRFDTHGKSAHGFSLRAGNGLEIAVSPSYGSLAETQKVASRLSGASFTSTGSAKTPSAKKAAPKKAAPHKVAPKKAVAKKVQPKAASEEQNYQPLAFYRRHTKGKNKGFEKFHGDDGEHYFTYFENSKLALISEGYPTAAIRDVGLASVEKNMKIEKRYVQGTGAAGKPGFIIRAGNHKEIARSVAYGSAAAAATGAAYLIGTRRRAAAAKVSPKKAPVKPRTAKPVVKKKAVKAAAPLAATGVVVAGLAAKKSKTKATTVKKASVPVKAAAVKPAPKPPTPKPRVPKKTIAVGSVAVAGLGAKAASTKASSVKAASVPVKAAAIVAAPIAVAAIAAAAIVTPKVELKPEPKVETVTAPIEAVAPVAAVSAAATAAAAPVAGAGIWGWLKWLLLALLALFALLFLFKACLGGSNEVATTAPAVTETAVPAAVMVTCWNGSKAKNDAACPAKITCWDNSFATSKKSCPVKPAAKDFDCWDGSKAVDQFGCPVKEIKASPTKMTAPSVAGRLCGTSSITLFDVRNSTPISVGRLGTNPQFGNSLGMSPDEFFGKLQVQYQVSQADKSFLNYMARSLGYGAFSDMNASMFTNDMLAKGTSGNLGFGSSHALQFSTLNVSDPSHLKAFKVRSANGTDVHFMKRCGNFMYVCQP